MTSYLPAFPLIAPADEKGFVYRGFIEINQTEHYVQIHLADRASNRAASIYGSQELQTLMIPYQATIQSRLDQCHDIGLFLSDLKDTLEQVCSSVEKIKPSSDRYGLLVAELNDIGYDKLETMNDTLDEFTFNCHDQCGRWHKVRVELPPQFPLRPPTITVEIPKTTCINASNATLITSPSSSSGEVTPRYRVSLSALLEYTLNTINKYQHFFDNMDQLDQQARVIDPEKPSRSDTWRRIALGNHCSVEVTIQEPSQPTSLPLVRFFGNEKKITPFQQAWQQFISTHQWRADRSVLDNLIVPLPSILRQPLTSPLSSIVDDTKEDDMACAICYTYKLNLAHDDSCTSSNKQQTPDIICSNQQCNRGFHPSCLFEWLRSNPTTTRSFNVLFGVCPYCNDKITIKAIV